MPDVLIAVLVVGGVGIYLAIFSTLFYAFKLSELTSFGIDYLFNNDWEKKDWLFAFFGWGLIICNSTELNAVGKIFIAPWAFLLDILCIPTFIPVLIIYAFKLLFTLKPKKNKKSKIHVLN